MLWKLQKKLMLKYRKMILNYNEKWQLKYHNKNIQIHVN